MWCKQFRLFPHISLQRGLSVCLSCVCLPSVCHMRAPCLNRSTDFRCHLAGTLTRSNDTFCRGKERFGGQASSQNMHCSQTISNMLPPGEYKTVIPPFAKLLLSVFYYKSKQKHMLKQKHYIFQHKFHTLPTIIVSKS